jgi:hypothetical protein
MKHELVLVEVQTPEPVQEPTHSLHLHTCVSRLQEPAPWTSPVPSSTAANTITQITLPRNAESTAFEDDIAPPEQESVYGTFVIEEVDVQAGIDSRNDFPFP